MLVTFLRNTTDTCAPKPSTPLALTIREILVVAEWNALSTTVSSVSAISANVVALGT
jgi:hypothetical protein